MAVYEQTNDPRVGSLNVHPFWALPRLPNILAEWAAIIPLACHLASFRTDYHTAGQIALAGQLAISLFPKLGVLASLSRLFKDGPEFLDEVGNPFEDIGLYWFREGSNIVQASVRGSSSRTVRDVQWGSVFPCANGAASAMIASYALARRVGGATRMPDIVPEKGHPGVGKVGTGSTNCDEVTNIPKTANGNARMNEWTWSGLTISSQIARKDTLSNMDRKAEVGHRRYQTLHVLNFSRNRTPRSWRIRLSLFLSSKVLELVTFMVVLGGCAVLSLCGLYGTAAALLCGSISQIAGRFVAVKRPPGYLDNNESHSACMLVSTHRNANIWYLYVGDRGIVDSLLNKTMIMIPTTGTNTVVAYLFKLTHVAQLLAVTYVAAQKSWDGVALVILMLVSWILQLRFTNDFMTRCWLESEDTSIETHSFEFTGRTIMIGAIQAFSGSTRTLWMDDIVVPHPRREAWLKKLREHGLLNESDTEYPTFTEVDLKAIEVTSGLAKSAAEIMKTEIKFVPTA